MEKWKARGYKILFPPKWLLISLMIISALGLIYVFTNQLEISFIAYVIYTISAYTLIAACLNCWKTIPQYYKNIKEKVYKNQYTNRYFTDILFKTRINLYRSFLINLIYVVMNAVSGIVYRTYWFGIFAVYYAIMSTMRFLLIRYMRKNQMGGNLLEELKVSRTCAYILLMINLTLSAIVLMMVYYNRGFEYQGILIYGMAAYTFYMTITAGIQMVKYHKHQSPIMTITKMIHLASALFSMLFLETAMFAQFGEDTSLEMQKIMIMATGAGISILVVGISLIIIFQTTKEINSHNFRHM